MTDIPEVVSDPIGVTVGLITGIEAGMDPQAAEAVVVGVAGGRAKRRKLAQALAQRPALLTDGRSPAPRVVGDLLIALVKAGATTISPPLCTECEAAADSAAARRGLVLRCLRPHPATVRELR